MAKPPTTPPSKTETGKEADAARSSAHAHGAAEQEEITRKGSKGRPPSSAR